MSSASIRSAVQLFMTQPPVPGLTNVVLALESENSIYADGTQPDSTFCVVHIVDETERRITAPAVLGITLVDYTIHLQTCHVFDGSGSDAVASLDLLVENMKTRIRSDPRLGQPPNVIFEAGQNPQPKIHVLRGQTEVVGDGIWNTWFAVEFVVTEQIAA